MKFISKIAISSLVVAVFPATLISSVSLQPAQAEEVPLDATAELEEPITPVESLTPEMPDVMPEAAAEPESAETAVEEAESEETVVETESEDATDVADNDSVESETAVESEASDSEVITEDSTPADSEAAIGGAELEPEAEAPDAADTLN